MDPDAQLSLIEPEPLAVGEEPPSDPFTRAAQNAPAPARAASHARPDPASLTMLATERAATDAQGHLSATLDPASQATRAPGRVAADARGHLYVGLDTGERANKTVAFDGESFAHYANPLAAVLDARWAPGTVIVFENSACSFDRALRLAFDAAMKERGLIVRAINPRDTKNRRHDWYPDARKTAADNLDELDAQVLWRIGVEGVIPKAKWTGDYRAKLSDNALVRARQLRYETEHADFPPDLRDLLALIRAQPVPEFATACGAAGKRKWKPEENYQIVTAAYIALTCPSRRKAKAILRKRCLARANLRHYPLKGKPRSVRKPIMRAQDQLIRWCQDLLAGRLKRSVPTEPLLMPASRPLAA